MVNKATITFDYPVSSVGDMLNMLLEQGVKLGDITMREQQNPSAVAEISSPTPQTKQKGQRRLTQREPQRLLQQEDKPRGHAKKAAPGRKKLKRSEARFLLGKITPLDIPPGGIILRNTRFCSLNELRNARTLNDVQTHPTEFDTILCPGTQDAVRDAFEGAHEWGWVAVSADKVGMIKNVAVYETATSGGRKSIIGVAPVQEYIMR